MQPVRVPRTLPVVLSRDEVARLIAAAPNLKSQTALSIAYGTGLRGLVLDVSDTGNQSAHLVLAHNHWKLVRHPHRLHLCHGLRATQRDFKEEVQTHNGGIQGDG